MKAVVRKWGNSESVRIPAAMMRATHLNLDQEVDIREEGRAVIIEPVQRLAHDLASLLDGITEDDLHGEVPTDDPIGHRVQSLATLKASSS